MSRAKSEPDRAQPPSITPRSPLVLVMAVACGLAVANLYYAQPLLDTLARSFGVSAGTAGFVVTASQLGYVLGLVAVVPLGDLLERRRLVALVTLGTSLAMAGAAASPSIGLFLAACVCIGATAVVAQVLVPLAADLAADDYKGAVVGRVMAGLLMGVLLARTVSGFVADSFGWRLVFWLAAALMAVQAALLWWLLPEDRPKSDVSYAELLRSVWVLFRQEPTLRRTIVYGAFGFAAFNVFWTSLAFLLARPPYGYSDTSIGLFGVFGAAGALCAAMAGRLHDRGLARGGIGVFLGSITASFVIMGLFPDHLAAIIVGVVLLDIGQQGTQVLNQSVIYELRDGARSRITTAYMTCFFFGGVLGSALSATTYQLAGWTGVSWLGGSFGAAAFGFWLTGGD